MPKKKGSKGGDPKAFVSFYDRLNGIVPKCATAVVM